MSDYFAIYRCWGQSEPMEPIEGLPGEDAPVTLNEIRVACVDLKLEAELRDVAGFCRGWVHADGNWVLR